MDHDLELTERAQATHFWFDGFRRFITPVLARVAAGRRDLRIVDCGCGTGHNLPLLEPYGTAVGFDLTPRGLDYARMRSRRLVRADVARAPFRDASFDLAVSFDVLQCVRDDVAAVGEMARILRPGGAAVLTMAALELLRGDHALAWNEARRHTPRSAAALVQGAGLHVEQTSFLFGSLFPLMLAVRAAQRALRRIRPPRRDADIAVPPAPVNAILRWMVGCEAAAARWVRAPIGSSILIVARKHPV